MFCVKEPLVTWKFPFSFHDFYLPTVAGSLQQSWCKVCECSKAQEICYMQLFTYCLQASPRKYNTYWGQLHFLEIILETSSTPLAWELLNWLRSYLHFVHLLTSNYVSVNASLNLISLIMKLRSCQWESVCHISFSIYSSVRIQFVFTVTVIVNDSLHPKEKV